MTYTQPVSSDLWPGRTRGSQLGPGCEPVHLLDHEVPRSELALLQDLLHGLPERYLSIAAGQTLPGEEVQPGAVACLRPLTFDLSGSEPRPSSSSSLCSSSSHGDLQQAWVSGTGLVVAVALRPAALRALPQVFERDAPEAATHLEVVGEEEELPALLHLRLHLQEQPGEVTWRTRGEHLVCSLTSEAPAPNNIFN